MRELLDSFLKLIDGKRKLRFWFLLGYMLLYSGIEVVAVAVLSGYVILLINIDGLAGLSQFQVFIDLLHLDLSNRKQLIIYAGFVVLLVVIIKNVTKLLLIYSVSMFSSNIGVDVGKYLIQGFLNMPYEWHMSQKTSDLVLVIQWRTQVGMMVYSILNMVADSILALIMLAAIFMLNVTLSMLVIGMVGMVGFFIFLVVKKRIDYNSTVLKDSNLVIHRSSSRAIYGFKEMKIYNMEQEAIDEFMLPARRYAKANALKDYYIPLPSLLIESFGIIFLVLYVTATLVFFNQSGAQITGELAMFVLIIWRTLPAVSRIVNNFTKFRKVLPVAKTVNEYVEKIFAYKKTYSFKPTTKTKPVLKKRLSLKGLDFQYEGTEKRTLDGLNFSIEKGMSLGVVGFSGSGKSTLADLLVGLLKPANGSLDIDGQKRSLEDHCIEIGNLAYVSQTPFFFDGTLAENIAFSIDNAAIDFSFLEKCCKMAALGDLLQSLPDGLKTMIGERGIRLSGGQLQRVAIARALYRRPDIILFDESTSSLDLKSEKEIQETINSLAGEITLIIIAHRLETVEKCDHIIWMDKGKILDSGPVSQILPRYRKTLR